MRVILIKDFDGVKRKIDIINDILLRISAYPTLRLALIPPSSGNTANTPRMGFPWSAWSSHLNRFKSRISLLRGLPRWGKSPHLVPLCEYRPARILWYSFAP
jgi:hypothetical protein